MNDIDQKKRDELLQVANSIGSGELEPAAAILRIKDVVTRRDLATEEARVRLVRIEELLASMRHFMSEAQAAFEEWQHTLRSLVEQGRRDLERGA